jgi:hypothetical protein
MFERPLAAEVVVTPTHAFPAIQSEHTVRSLARPCQCPAQRMHVLVQSQGPRGHAMAMHVAIPDEENHAPARSSKSRV